MAVEVLAAVILAVLLTSFREVPQQYLKSATTISTSFPVIYVLNILSFDAVHFELFL